MEFLWLGLNQWIQHSVRHLMIGSTSKDLFLYHMLSPVKIMILLHLEPPRSLIISKMAATVQSNHLDLLLPQQDLLCLKLWTWCSVSKLQWFLLFYAFMLLLLNDGKYQSWSIRNAYWPQATVESCYVILTPLLPLPFSLSLLQMLVHGVYHVSKDWSFYIFGKRGVVMQI